MIVRDATRNKGQLLPNVLGGSMVSMQKIRVPNPLINRRRKRSAGYSVRPLVSRRNRIVVLIGAKKTVMAAFFAISSSGNSRLFTLEAALGAFACI